MKDRSLIDRASPLKLGLLTSASLLAILFLAETGLGRWDAIWSAGTEDPLARAPTGALRDFRIAVVHCLLLGYLPAALLHVIRYGRRTIFSLQSALDCTPRECAKLAASLNLSRIGLILTGLLGVTLALVGPYLVPPIPEGVWNPSTWSPEVWWHRVPGLFVGVLGLWLGYAIVVVSLRMSRIAEKLDRIDLLDLSPLSPFAQQGLTHALLLVGVLSIQGLMMFESGFGVVLVLFGIGTFLFCALALWAPVRGVNIRVRREKQAELAWINARIAKARGHLIGEDVDAERGELADLVAYRTVVETAPDWPFTGSTYARLVIYALIPAASWVFGIVLEQLVENTLF